MNYKIHRMIFRLIPIVSEEKYGCEAVIIHIFMNNSGQINNLSFLTINI